MNRSTPNWLTNTLLPVVAGLSVFDPERTLIYGTVVTALIFLLRNPLRLRTQVTVTVPLALAAWALLSATWSRFPSASLMAGLTWTCLAVLFIGFRHTVSQEETLVRNLMGFIAGAVLATVRMLVESGLGIGEQRLTLGDLNQNYLAYAFATALAALYVHHLLRPTRPLLKLLIGVVILVGLYATGTRAALISVVLLALWVALAPLFAKPPTGVLAAGGGVVAALIVTGAIDTLSASFDTGSRGTGDWSGRLVMWPVAREEWAQAFWRGSGASTFGAESGFGISAHNAILQTGTGMGVVGVVLLLGAWCAALHCPRSSCDKARALAVGGLIATQLPCWLTGVWEPSPAAWIAMALVSQVRVAAQKGVQGHTAHGRATRGLGGPQAPEQTQNVLHAQQQLEPGRTRARSRMYQPSRGALSPQSGRKVDHAVAAIFQES